MLNFKAHQHPAWGHLKKAHLEGMRASVQDLRLTKKRLRTAFQSGAGGEGLISRYKREYQIAIGRHLTPDQRPLVDVPSHRFPMGRSKDAGLHWDKCAGKGWGKGKGYGKNSNKRYGMGADKGADKREDQSRGDKWQKDRKKKSFDTD